jgi:hypothetical protein
LAQTSLGGALQRPQEVKLLEKLLEADCCWTEESWMRTQHHEDVILSEITDALFEELLVDTVHAMSQ